ncbi:MAG: rRNA maturation RNase YbeY [Acidobacteriota bacterium]|nr:rRNA maturation RNase YbeY [Acidobacteriota bacterium]
MIEVVNRQRKIKINLEDWRVYTVRAAAKIVETDGKSLTVAFVSDRKMRELNLFYRNKNSTTDVLSFASEPDEFEPDDDNLGDIVISVEQAAQQASENQLDFETEIKQLILHGILHLCGHDHETDDGEMNARELRLRRTLRI